MIWDGYNFFSCGNKKIIKSADGLVWAEDATFTADDEPKLLAYRGEYFDIDNLDYSSPHGIEELPTNPYGPYQVPYGQIYAISKTGKWYATVNYYQSGPWVEPVPTYAPEWWVKTQGDEAPNNYLPFAAPNRQFNPSGFVATRVHFQAACTSGHSVYQEFWSAALGYIEHRHLDGKQKNVKATIAADANESVNVPDQEPSVMRGWATRDGSDPVVTSIGNVNFNNLAVHNEIPEKAYASTILCWLHGRKLLVSTDAGQTWSKGRTVIIPTRNGVYDSPDSMKAYPGHEIKAIKVTDGELNLTSTPMVSDGTDVFCASYYAPEGLVFLNLTWDGLHLYTGDPDDVQEDTEEVIPDAIEVNSETGEDLVFTFYPVTVT